MTLRALRCRPVERRDERVVIETGRHRITGTVSLPKEGHRSRLSDYLNQGGPAFLALADAEIEPLEGGSSERRGFVAVATGQIVLIGPDGES